MTTANINTKNLTKEQAAAVTAVINKAMEAFNATGFLDRRGLDVITFSFDERKISDKNHPGQFVYSNGTTARNESSAIIKLSKYIEITPDGIVTKVPNNMISKDFASVLIHEISHAVVWGATDNINHDNYASAGSYSKYMIGEFVFRSVVVNLTKQVYGEVDPSEVRKLEVVRTALMAPDSPYRKSVTGIDWEHVNPEQIFELLKDPNNPIRALIPDKVRGDAFDLGIRDYTPESGSIIERFPKDAILDDIVYDEYGNIVGLSFTRKDGIKVDAESFDTNGDGIADRIVEQWNVGAHTSLGDGAQVTQIRNLTVDGIETDRHVTELEFPGYKMRSKQGGPLPSPICW